MIESKGSLIQFYQSKIDVFVIYVQVTTPLAHLYNGFPKECCRVFGGHGVLHRHPFWHVDPSLCVHSHIQLENDQGHGLLHVPFLLCLCPRFLRLWVRFLLLPLVKRYVNHLFSKCVELCYALLLYEGQGLAWPSFLMPMAPMPMHKVSVMYYLETQANKCTSASSQQKLSKFFCFWNNAIGLGQGTS